MKRRQGLSANVIGTSLYYNLYDTTIMVVSDYTIRLNSGGWKTAHTKNCMNDNLPDDYRVFQKEGVWYVDTPKETLDFVDHMVIELDMQVMQCIKEIV